VNIWSSTDVPNFKYIEKKIFERLDILTLVISVIEDAFTVLIFLYFTKERGNLNQEYKGV
jgi:hypothetical protein